MSTKTTKVNVRIDSELKELAEKILDNIGLNASDAIRTFYKMIVLNKGLPFELKIPNEETLQAMHDADTGNNLISYDSIEEMFNDLEN